MEDVIRLDLQAVSFGAQIGESKHVQQPYPTVEVDQSLVVIPATIGVEELSKPLVGLAADYSASTHDVLGEKRVSGWMYRENFDKLKKKNGEVVGETLYSPGLMHPGRVTWARVG